MTRPQINSQKLEQALFTTAAARPGMEPRWYKARGSTGITNHVMVGPASGLGGMDKAVHESDLKVRQKAFYGAMFSLVHGNQLADRFYNWSEAGKITEALCSTAEDVFSIGTRSSVVYAVHSARTSTVEQMASRSGLKVSTSVSQLGEPAKMSGALVGLGDASTRVYPPHDLLLWYLEDNERREIYQQDFSMTHVAGKSLSISGHCSVFGLLPPSGSLRGGLFPMQRRFAKKDSKGKRYFAHQHVSFGLLQAKLEGDSARTGMLHDVTFGLAKDGRIVVATVRSVEHAEWLTMAAADVHAAATQWVHDCNMFKP